MNKITVSPQGCENIPTLENIKSGTIFSLPRGANPHAWYIKTDLPGGGWVRLSDGIRFNGIVSTPVKVLMGSIRIELENNV